MELKKRGQLVKPFKPKQGGLPLALRELTEELKGHPWDDMTANLLGHELQRLTEKFQDHLIKMNGGECDLTYQVKNGRDVFIHPVLRHTPILNREWNVYKTNTEDAEAEDVTHKRLGE